MFVKKSISNGRVYLVYAQGYRINGKVRHKTIEKIGYLDELEKIYDDPISHFKEIAKQMNKENIKEYTIKNLNTKIIDNSSKAKNLGYVALREIYKELDLETFFKDKNQNSKIKFDLNKIFSLLVYSRIMYPASKKETFEKRERFFEDFDGFELEDIYRSLDYFNQYKEEIETLLWNNTKDTYQRNADNLYYVLSHEASHYFHHDLFVKFGINLLCIIYWWNPAVYLFRKQAVLLLEMQVDDKVIGGSKDNALAYLDCLVKVKELTFKKEEQQMMPANASLSFLKGERTELERRFGLIVDSGRSRKKWINILLTALILGIYFLSYQFIFEPYYSPDSVKEDLIGWRSVYYPQTQDIYAVENVDGSFSVYIRYFDYQNDLYIETTDDIKKYAEIADIYYLKKGQLKK